MKDEAKPREWVLRINSNNDGGGYLYSGSDVRYPEDDYLEVVEKKAYDALAAENAKLRLLVFDIREMVKHALHLDYLGGGSTKGWAERLINDMNEALGREGEK